MLPPTSISLRCRGPLGNSASGFIFLQKAKEHNFMYRKTKIDLCGNFNILSESITRHVFIKVPKDQKF